MSATLDEVLALAKNTHALSEEQLSRILAIAPEMGPADLEKLKGVLLGVQEAEVKDMKNSLIAEEQKASAYEDWKATQARQIRDKAESTVKNNDMSVADSLIKSLSD